MTSSLQPHRPGDLTGRFIVTGVGALFLLVVALIGFTVSDWVLPGVLILLLIPVHIVLAITDTSILESPKTVPSRAIAELKRLASGSSAGTHGATAAGAGQFRAPTTGGTPFHGTPTVGPAAFSGPIPLSPGRSFDPPGPHGPSVVHGFGSYGRHDAAEPSRIHAFGSYGARADGHLVFAPPPASGEEAPPAPAPEKDQERALSSAAETAPEPETAPTPDVTPDLQATRLHWEFADADEDFDDPDMTIQRPPRNP